MSEPMGWKALLAGYGEPDARPFPLPAYSEFMPAPRLGRKPYGEPDVDLFAEDDPLGWRVSEAEQAWELAPGLEHIAREVYASLLPLGQGREEHLIRGHGGRNLAGNPYWPPELAAAAGRLPHERFVSLLPLALSRTQDDKGRVRWTLFGSSEHGPGRAFWRSFAAGSETGPADAVAFLARLLRAAYGEDARTSERLAALGFRILPSGPHHPQPAWAEELPAWTAPLSLGDGGPFDDVRYLLTFRPFASLPEDARRRYLAGDLHLLPFPGSLVFWGMPTFLRLAEELPVAMQLPLLRLTRRHQGPGIRIPQSGWLHEPGPEKLERELHDAYMRETFTRTHRWDRVLRHENELDVLTHADKVARVLFATDLDAMGLYDKPMARNAQLWTSDFRRVLDGPQANAEEIAAARDRVIAGGTFGYRFVYPAMRVGAHEVTWHRPLVAFVPPGADTPTLLDEGPLGYLAASPDAAGGDTIELFPRVLQRPLQLAAVTELRRRGGGAHEAENVLALAAAWRGLGERPLPRSFARRLLKLAKDETVEAWLDALPGRTADPEAGRRLREGAEALLQPAGAPGDGHAVLTYGATATRRFEEAYWRDIATLAHGEYLTKDNADCVRDAVTQAHLPHHRRDLEPLGDYLIERHRRSIAAAGMTGKAFCGELPFAWRTDFPFDEFGGWLANREGKAHERDIVVAIPGRDRRHAVVLADHYDTAYMEDVYDTSKGGSGARLAAHGADDNHSATATLLQAAPIYLDLAKQGRLERDVWLVHLTGEEFPADCMGARALCRALMERAVVLPGADGDVDLSATRVVGLVVMDMIAHNRADHPYVFQIAPGDGPGALRVALAAHLANEAWNALAATLNATPERRGRGPSTRSADPAFVPPVAAVPRMRGEVRLHFEPRSSLYNTDGQVFSDVGVPAALFMEDYDIDRQGYHDTHDTMENIDLDYGAALAAIAIETIARLATAEGGRKAE
ncbi:MAG: M28 family peptidase [Acidobacteria bacterium]|nr:MAG: M28 family peptidase [Acidobacteriota bacterium]